MTETPTRNLLAALEAALARVPAKDQDVFRCYLLGALASSLERLPHGDDVWTEALDVASQLVNRK